MVEMIAVYKDEQGFYRVDVFTCESWTESLEEAVNRIQSGELLILISRAEDWRDIAENMNG